MSGSPEKFVIEPERYEFSAGPVHHFELLRRDFFKLLGAGIAVFTMTKDAGLCRKRPARASTRKTCPRRSAPGSILGKMAA